MKQYQSRAELKDRAKGLLTGRYGTSVLIHLTPFMILYAITFMFTMVLTTITMISSLSSGALSAADTANQLSSVPSNAFSVPAYILSFVVAVFYGVFGLGMALYYLNIACGRRGTLADLFTGFRKDIKRVLSISLLLALVSWICQIPYDITNWIASARGDIRLLILSYGLLLIGQLAAMVILLYFSQCWYLMLDFPQYNAVEIIKLSIRIMRGHKMRLFLLELSFLPLEFAGILSFGIGLLWVMPYVHMTSALFFLDLMNPKTAESSDMENFMN